MSTYDSRRTQQSDRCKKQIIVNEHQRKPRIPFEKKFLNLEAIETYSFTTQLDYNRRDKISLQCCPWFTMWQNSKKHNTTQPYNHWSNSNRTKPQTIPKVTWMHISWPYNAYKQNNYMQVISHYSDNNRTTKLWIVDMIYTDL